MFQLYHGEKKINVKENRRGNQEWTIQIHWQHWIYKTQDEDKQNTTQKAKKRSNTDPTKSRGLVHVLVKVTQFMPLITHPSSYSYIQDVLDTTVHKQAHR